MANANTNAKITITAEDKTRAAFAQVQGGLERMDKSVGLLSGGVAGLATAFGSAFAVGETVAFLHSTIDALDALNDAADATGATVENLSALEDVARRNGGTLDQVTGALVKFNQALNATDGDKSPAALALKAIGVSTKELRSLDPAEALRQVAVALDGFADNGEKARIVQDLFGKSVREVGPFLKDLAEQGKLNAKVTTEQAKAAETFNKQLYEMETNASNLARTVVSQLIPAINEYAKKAAAAAETLSLKDLFTVDRDILLGTSAEQALLKYQARLDEIIAQREKLNDFSDAQEIADLDKQAEQLKRLVDYYKKIAVFKDTFNDRRASGEVSTEKPKLKRLPAPQPDRGDPLQEAIDASVKRMEDWWYKNQETLDKIDASFGAIQAADEQLKNDFLRSEKAAYDQIEEEAKAQRERIHQFTEGIKADIEDALGATVENVLEGHFNNIAKLWEQMLIRMAAQAIQADLSSKLFGPGGAGNGVAGFLANLFGNGQGGYGTGGLYSGASGGAATGANVSAGQLWRVNERGTEWFRPNVGGQIIPLGTGQGPGDGNTIINVASGVNRAELQAAMQLAVSTAEARVFARLRRTKNA